MTKLQFVSNVVDSVVWPLVVLVLVLTFRKTIADLIGRISSIHSRWGRMDFAKNMSVLKERVDKIEEVRGHVPKFEEGERKDYDVDPPDRALSFISVARHVARRNPCASISTSWAGVNRELTDTCERLGLISSGGGWRGFGETSRLLHDRGYVDDDVLDILQNYDQLEGSASQTSCPEITRQEAEVYRIYCRAIINFLREMKKRD